MTSKYTNWKKSSRSGGGGDNCVEVAFAADGAVGVRDSKDREGPVLEFTRTEWIAFIEGAQEGEFSH